MIRVTLELDHGLVGNTTDKYTAELAKGLTLSHVLQVVESVLYAAGFSFDRESLNLTVTTSDGVKEIGVEYE